MERGKLQIHPTLSNASFFIYCTHYIFILEFTIFAFNKIFKMLKLGNTIASILTYFIAPFACAGIILCIYLLMKKFTPKILNIFTGNRQK